LNCCPAQGQSHRPRAPSLPRSQQLPEPIHSVPQSMFRRKKKHCLTVLTLLSDLLMSLNAKKKWNRSWNANAKALKNGHLCHAQPPRQHPKGTQPTGFHLLPLVKHAPLLPRSQPLLLLTQLYAQQLALPMLLPRGREVSKLGRVTRRKRRRVATSHYVCRDLNMRSSHGAKYIPRFGR
jgi:hypothetical protein